MESNPSECSDERRILLKISGEVLIGEDGFGICAEASRRLADDICEARNLDRQLCLVIGGGNIYRGLSAAGQGIDRVAADQMGMLATVMNALAVQSALEARNVPTRVLSGIPMTTVCEPYIKRRAVRHLEKGRIVIFAAGTGNPFFTTDTAAVLRALETGCGALYKGTTVDGVYDSDPKHNPDAKRLDSVTYTQILSQDLKVMDSAAVALARDNRLPIKVFAVGRRRALASVLDGSAPCTAVTVDEPRAGRN